jgi:hypothetical protein
VSTESTFDYGDDEQQGHMMTKAEFDKVKEHMFKKKELPCGNTTDEELSDNQIWAK